MSALTTGPVDEANNYTPTPTDNHSVSYGNIGVNLSFPRDHVVVKRELGRGAFGRVLLGTAIGIEVAGTPTTVAIKTLKGKCT